MMGDDGAWENVANGWCLSDGSCGSDFVGRRGACGVWCVALCLHLPSCRCVPVSGPCARPFLIWAPVQSHDAPPRDAPSSAFEHHFWYGGCMRAACIEIEHVSLTGFMPAALLVSALLDGTGDGQCRKDNIHRPREHRPLGVWPGIETTPSA